MDDNFARIFPFELTNKKIGRVGYSSDSPPSTPSYTPSNRNELTGLLSNLLTYLLGRGLEYRGIRSRNRSITRKGGELILTRASVANRYRSGFADPGRGEGKGNVWLRRWRTRARERTKFLKCRCIARRRRRRGSNDETFLRMSDSTGYP